MAFAEKVTVLQLSALTLGVKLVGATSVFLQAQKSRAIVPNASMIEVLIQVVLIRESWILKQHE
jgi:hypothetical protein